MNQFGIKFLAILAVSLVLLATKGHCLEEVCAREQKCFEVKETSALDANWLASLKTQFYPLMSRLDLYRFTRDLLHDSWKDLNEADLYYDACLEFTFGKDGTYRARGFGGLEYYIKVEPLLPDFSKIQFDHEGYAGICDVTKTDNSTYVFFACCFDDDQMTWGVVSPMKTLPKETVTLIHEHAVSLGFKKEYFTGLRYDLCDKEDAENNGNANTGCPKDNEIGNK